MPTYYNVRFPELPKPKEGDPEFVGPVRKRPPAPPKPVQPPRATPPRQSPRPVQGPPSPPAYVQARYGRTAPRPQTPQTQPRGWWDRPAELPRALTPAPAYAQAR